MNEQIIHINSSQAYDNPYDNFKVGEVAYFTDLEEFKFWDGTIWQAIPENVELVNNGLSLNLYDLNKQIMSQMPILKEWTNAESLIHELNNNLQATYYMLLCKDISYYTLFTHTEPFAHCSTFGEAVLSCAENVGSIVSVEFTDENKTAIEIWVRQYNTNEMFCMYLFNADPMVVTYAYGGE